MSTRRPHEDLYCDCEPCKAWDKTFFAECGCLCGGCKTNFVKELKARGTGPEGLEGK